MRLRLDRRSRDTVARFILKLAISAIIATFGKTFILTMSLWLSLYALFSIVFAVLVRDRLRTDGFNHWSEALWLTLSAVGLRLLNGVVS